MCRELEQHWCLVGKILIEKRFSFEYKSAENMIVTSHPIDCGEMFYMFHFDGKTIDNFCIHSMSIDRRMTEEVNLMISEINKTLESGKFFLDSAAYSLAYTCSIRKRERPDNKRMMQFCQQVFDNTRKYTKEIYEIAGITKS